MNKPSEAIVLAGGFGTRLADISGDLPKPMVPVAGKAFLEYILDYLLAQGIETVVLSTGYKHEYIESHFGSNYKGLEIHYQEEKDPLGTGGGIKFALEKCKGDLVWVLNGDSFFDVDLNLALERYPSSNPPLLLMMKRMLDFNRYGSIETDAKGVVKAFHEKREVSEGLINAGVYLLSKSWLNQVETRSKFSFEQDILEKQVASGHICAQEHDGYFIDIGIPEDYTKAQDDFRQFKY